MATNIFQSGQKLTAADLNSAIDSIAGVQNPSNDYKWQQTSLGRMQTTWSTFLNTESEIASPLDIGVAVQQLDQPIFVGNQQISGVRRLFMNVGNAVYNEYFGQRIVPNVPRIGTLNGFPFVGVIGAQLCSRRAPYGPKDGNIHFSMWANFGEDVEISSYTPAEWTRVQKLYDDDVARNASPTNWWYTGICIENQSLDPSLFPELFTIKCYPMYVPVSWKDEGKDNQMWYMPFLVVCTAYDTNIVRGMLLGQHGSALKQLIEQHFGDEHNWNVQVLGDPVMVIEPTNEIDIAQYVGQPGTISQQYKQLVNDVKFVYDFSAGHIHGLHNNDKLYDLGVVQYINSDGVQKVASTDLAQVTDLEGNLIDADDCQAMLAMAYCFETKEAVLSCVSCDYSNIALSGVVDPVQTVLEPLFTSLEGDGRTIEKRLIWVNRCGARGLQYFDTCPSFFKESVPDSSVSALEPGLSSLQAKTSEFEVESIIDPETKLSCERQIWSLYDFDNLSNVADLPSEEYELEKYNIITRYVDDDKAWLKYVSLSSLSGGGGVLSGDANWANKNQLSSWSIETKTLSGDVKYHTLWGFQEDPQDASLQTKLSAGVFTDIVPDLHNNPSITRELLVRETTHHGNGNSQELKYVDIDLQPPDFKGDADLSAIDYSIEGSTIDGDYLASLYNFHGNGQDQNVPLSSAQGRKFYWPQGTQWGTPTSENEYFLTKTVDQTTGETVLKYKRLVVEFPDIEIPDIDALSTWIEQEFYDINVEIANWGQDVVYLSGVIDQLSADLSALSSSCWLRGGSSQTNYGTSIGNSANNTVIDLTNRTLVGSWQVDNLATDNDLNITGMGRLVIGGTALSQYQLQQLLALIQAVPQAINGV